MINVDNLEAAVLSQARGESRLSSDQRAAQWTAIESRLSLGNVPVVDVPAPADGLWGAASPLQMLILGLAVGGVVGLGVGSFQSEDTSALPPPRAAVKSVPEAQEVILQRLPKESFEVEPRSAQEGHQEPDAGVRETLHSPNSRASADDAAAPAPKLMSFHEELAYLQRAQGALHRGQPAMALGLMLSLDEMQKTGALQSERQMTQVLALCALGRTEEARVVGGRLISESGGSLYAERLRRSCAAASDDTKSDDGAILDEGASSDDSAAPKKNTSGTNGMARE